MDSYNQYWQLLYDMYYRANYLTYYRHYINAKHNLTELFLTVISLSSISTWFFWQQYPQIWAAILFFTQVIHICNLISPSSKLVVPLKYSIVYTNKIITDMEIDFRKIHSENLNNSKIDELIAIYQKRYEEVDTLYLSDTEMPIRQDFKRKAISEANKTINVRFN